VPWHSYVLLPMLMTQATNFLLSLISTTILSPSISFLLTRVWVSMILQMSIHRIIIYSIKFFSSHTHFGCLAASEHSSISLSKTTGYPWESTLEGNLMVFIISLFLYHYYIVITDILIVNINMYSLSVYMNIYL